MLDSRGVRTFVFAHLIWKQTVLAEQMNGVRGPVDSIVTHTQNYNGDHKVNWIKYVLNWKSN